MEKANTKKGHTVDTDKLNMSHQELDAFITQTSQKVVRQTLIDIGLLDEEAASDLRALRRFARTLKAIQQTFVQTAVRWLTIGLLVLVFAGLTGKLGALMKVI